MAEDADDETRAAVSNQLDPDRTFMALPSVFSTEQPTMQLRWYNGVLEQAFLRNGIETVWRPIPAIGYPRPI